MEAKLVEVAYVGRPDRRDLDDLACLEDDEALSRKTQERLAHRRAAEAVLLHERSLINDCARWNTTFENRSADDAVGLLAQGARFTGIIEQWRAYLRLPPLLSHATPSRRTAMPMPPPTQRLATPRAPPPCLGETPGQIADDAGSAGAERMAERHGAAMRIDGGRLEPQRSKDCENLAGKGFVDFPVCNVAERKFMAGQKFMDRGDGTNAHARWIDTDA